MLLALGGAPDTAALLWLAHLALEVHQRFDWVHSTLAVGGVLGAVTCPSPAHSALEGALALRPCCGRRTWLLKARRHYDRVLVIVHGARRFSPTTAAHWPLLLALEAAPITLMLCGRGLFPRLLLQPRGYCPVYGHNISFSLKILTIFFVLLGFFTLFTTERRCIGHRIRYFEIKGGYWNLSDIRSVI